MSKQLLVDTILFEVSPELVNESISSNKPLIVSGILQRANAKNQNGRVYPHNVLMRESKKYSTVQIKERRALGELDHPNSSIVNLNNVSHNVRKMWWEGNDLLGEVEILGTPAGNILKELFKAGIKLGISSRGLGSVQMDESNSNVVQDDFELIAFDFVSNPSTQGAFMYQNGLNEGVNLENNQEFSKYGKINSIITDILSGA